MSGVEKLSVLDNQTRDRALILGYPVDLIGMEGALRFAEECISSVHGGHVITINPEMIMFALKNPEFSEILKNADLIIPDGIGVIISLKKIGITDVKQLPGIEFSHSLIQKCIENNYRIGFLGASKDVLDAMIQNFKTKYPSINIAFARDGYFKAEDESAILENIKNSRVQVLFVALGVPKQEIWINKYKDILNSTIMVGVGGSFDVWANKVKRAPYIFRKLGLEWFFRLISQPSRFSRMFPTLPLFFIKVFLDRENTRKER